METNNSTLPIGTILHSSKYSYKIVKVLGQGSFGITYLANVMMDGPLGSLESNMHVAIKEFFVKNLNDRDGYNVTSIKDNDMLKAFKHHFQNEVQALSKLKHPNIVKMIGSFDANQTSYYVMEYVEGTSLDKGIDLAGHFSEEKAIGIIKSICSAVQYMHDNNVLHLDIKPNNIILSNDGRVILIDFGMATILDEYGSTVEFNGGTPGYAPLEQMSGSGNTKVSPATDVYAIAATLYKMLTGERAPEAVQILNDGFPTDKLLRYNIREKVIKAIKMSMEPLSKNRIQSVNDFVDVLEKGNILNKERTNSEHKDTIKSQNKVDGSIVNPLPEPYSIHIVYMLNDKDSEGLGYDISLNSKTYNNFKIFYKSKKIAEECRYGEIYPDVKSYMSSHGFFSREHWELEGRSLSKSKYKGNVDVSIELCYRENLQEKKFLRKEEHVNNTQLAKEVWGMIRLNSIRRRTSAEVHKYMIKVLRYEPIQLKGDTEKVAITYIPQSPNIKDCYNLLLTPSEISASKVMSIKVGGEEWNNSKFVSHHVYFKIDFDEFLKRLSALLVRSELIPFSQEEYSESPSSITIRIYNREGMYAEYISQFISGKTFGNLVSIPVIMSKTIIDSVPGVKDILQNASQILQEPVQTDKDIFTVKCPQCGAKLMVRDTAGIEYKNITCPKCKHHGRMFADFKGVSEYGFYPMTVGDAEYGTEEVLKIPVIDPIPMPDHLYLKLMPNNKVGTGYKIWLHPIDQNCNTILIYKDGKNVVDWDGPYCNRLEDDVKQFLLQKGFLSKKHWEVETFTTPTGPDFGFTVEFEAISDNVEDGGKPITFVRYVSNAHPHYHHILLDAIKALLDVPSVSKSLKEANLSMIKSLDEDTFFPADEKMSTAEDCIRIFSISKNLSFEYFEPGLLLLDDSGEGFMNKVAGGLTFNNVNINKSDFVASNDSYKSLEDYVSRNVQKLRQSYNFITYRSLNDYVECCHLVKQYGLRGRLSQETDAMAFAVEDRISDKIVELTYGDRKCYLEYGGGVIEVLGNSLETSHINPSDIKDEIVLNDDNALAMLMVSIARWYYAITSDKYYTDDTLLNSNPFPIYFVITDRNHRLIYSQEVIQAYSSLPCKQSVKISFSDSFDLYLKIGGLDYQSILTELGGDISKDKGKLYPLNISDRFPSVPKNIKATVDFDAKDMFNIFLQDVDSDREVKISFLDLV